METERDRNCRKDSERPGDPVGVCYVLRGQQAFNTNLKTCQGPWPFSGWRGCLFPRFSYFFKRNWYQCHLSSRIEFPLASPQPLVSAQRSRKVSWLLSDWFGFSNQRKKQERKQERNLSPSLVLLWSLHLRYLSCRAVVVGSTTPRPSRFKSTLSSQAGSALRHRRVADCPELADSVDTRTCPRRAEAEGLWPRGRRVPQVSESWSYRLTLLGKHSTSRFSRIWPD